MDIQRPDLRRKQRLRRSLWIFSGAILVLSAITILYRLEPSVPKVDRMSVWVETVREGGFVREIRGSGTLVPRETRLVSSTSPGTVEKILVRPGASVDAETVLVEISNPQLTQETEEYHWELEAMSADLISLEAELERQLLDARASHASVKADLEAELLEAAAQEELSERGIVSRIQYQQTRLRANQLDARLRFESERIQNLEASIKAQLVAEQARLEQARQRYSRYEMQLEGLRVRAGVSGVLQRIDVEEGQQISAASAVGQVARPDELIAVLRIPESQAQNVQLGLGVNIDTGNAEAAGRVTRIDPAVVGGTVQVDVEIVSEVPSGARPDLSVTGTIQLERVENVLYISRPASGQPESTISLFRLGENDEAERVAVELGRASIGDVEILSGLKLGDRVILSNTSQWDDHNRIRLY